MTINIPDSCTFWFNAAVLGGLAYIIYTVFKVDRMYAVFPKICDALTRISEILLQKGMAKETLFTTASPLKLTPNGEKLIEQISFLNFYESNKRLLLDRIRKDNPKSMADLEEICKKLCYKSKIHCQGLNP